VPFSAIPDHLTTERLDLTPEVPDDAGWLATLFTARGTGLVTPAEAAVRIRAMQQVVAEHGIGARVLRRHDDGTPLGYCAIVVGRGTLAEPELAYELLPEAQGHGYATEGSRVLLAAAFATGRERVWSTVRESNGASLRVLARLGFRRDRVTQDERGAREQGALVWHVAEAPAGRR
jgi:RimJ/RimL family protein N-acetyltransferase